MNSTSAVAESTQAVSPALAAAGVWAEAAAGANSTAELRARPRQRR